MVDSLQRSSTVPVPSFQTEQGTQNPLPLNAPKEMNRLDDVAEGKRDVKSADAFEDYLNQSSITTVPSTADSGKGLEFDPAAAIASASVYAQTSGKSPI